jgi:serine/threonine protein kinase
LLNVKETAIPINSKKWISDNFLELDEEDRPQEGLTSILSDLELKKSNSAQEKSSLRSTRDGLGKITQTGANVGSS